MRRITSSTLGLADLVKATLLAALWGTFIQPVWCSEPLTGAAFGPAVSYYACHGDVWTSTWADDGELYAICDDAIFAPGSGANWAINKLSGDDPRRLTRTVVNMMQDYGNGGAMFGPEKYTWKGNSILSVDGVLYASVSRHDYPHTHNPLPEDLKQTVQDASIVKSTDHGKTWTHSMKENLAHPTFPGRKFATPFFIQYGKDCSVKAHGSERFVYAVSNDGYWNNGNTLIIGRAARDRIGNLNGADWEFYRGGDGMQGSAWTSNADHVKALVSDPDRMGMSAVAYIPQRQRYVLLQWHYPKNVFTGAPTTWVLRESPTPWGPWTSFATTVYGLSTQYYNPCMMAKFIEDDGQRLWIATNGLCVSQNDGLVTLPITVSTDKSLKLSANHLRFTAGLGLGDPAPQMIDVRLGNKPPPDVQVTIVGSPQWLAVKCEPGGDRLRIVNHIKNAGLPVGNYEVDVLVRSAAAEPSQTRYQVCFEVCSTHEAATASVVKPGLTYEYVESDKLDRQTDLSKVSVLRRGIWPVPELNLPRRRECYGVRFQGCFKAPRDGLYTFYAARRHVWGIDAGTRLIIDSERVIDRGNWPYYPERGSIWLRQGLHPVTVEYYQRQGPSVLELYVAPPDQGERKLEAGDFVHASEKP